MRCFNHVLKQQGCDRHLLGMKIIAMEKGHKLPLLFQDKSYKLRWGTNQQLQKSFNVIILLRCFFSGGDGNFLISTSLCGYSMITGAVSPMVYDGYGIFYAVPNNR